MIFMLILTANVLSCLQEVGCKPHVLNKDKSNHQNTKKDVIKGYSDRARALCDPQYLQNELQNIEDVFVENGYSRREVRKAMEERQTTENEEEERAESESRGIVSIPHIPSFTRTFSRIAKQHKFRTTTRAANKVRDITSKA